MIDALKIATEAEMITMQEVVASVIIVSAVGVAAALQLEVMTNPMPQPSVTPMANRLV